MESHILFIRIILGLIARGSWQWIKMGTPNWKFAWLWNIASVTTEIVTKHYQMRIRCILSIKGSIARPSLKNLQTVPKCWIRYLSAYACKYMMKYQLYQTIHRSSPCSNKAMVTPIACDNEHSQQKKTTTPITYYLYLLFDITYNIMKVAS